MGEGAVQCILSEDNVGFCKGTDAGNDVAADAFSMCNGQEDAIPNSHKTITATVVVQTSMPSIVLIAPAANSTSSSSSSLSTSQSSSKLPTPTTLTTSASTPAKTSNTSTTTSAEAASIATKATDPTLTKSQKIAIAVASVGGVALVVGILLLMVCLRRRRRRSRDSDMLPFQADPGTPRFYGGFRGTMETKSARSSPGNWGKNAPRIPPRLETSDPYMFARSSVRPETIGIAISPERNIRNYAKRSSRLLPDKPTLKLNTNQPVAGPVVQSDQPSRQFSRQSTATEFEEEDSADTAIDGYFGRGSNDQILPKEDASNLKTIKVIQSDARPSLYITNPDNSPPRNQTVTTSPESYIKPLAIGRGVGSFSRPRPGPDPRALQIPIPSRTTSQNQNARPITASSSIYSSASNTPYTAAPSTGPLSSNPFPIPLSNLYRPENQQQKPKAYKQTGPYDRASNGSFTSFDSVDSSPDREQPRHTIMLDLSPVAESPASPTGRSPVSYPKIAPGRLSQQTIRMVPPPPQPDFASVFSSGGGRSQPNTQPIYNANIVVQKPWQAAEIAAARQRRISAAQNQASARSQTYPIPQTQVQTKSVTAEEIRQIQNENGGQAQMQGREPLKPGPKLASPFKPQPTYQPPSRAPTHTRQRSRDYIAPSAHFNQAQLRPNAHLRDGSKTPSMASFASQNSTSSSLLAKRLGAEKAAQLSLQMRSQEEEKKIAKWRVLGKEEREKAKEVGWKPVLAGRVEAERGYGGGQQSGGQLYAGYGSDGNELPRTPGWVPRLTPTRRGDELFLSVA